MSKKKKTKDWANKRGRDIYYKESKIQGYRSRSAFKLLDLNKKFRFLNNNTNVLDIGSSPGGWSQVLSKIIKKGKIVAIDIQDMRPIENVQFFNLDFTDHSTKKLLKEIFQGKIDTIVSDMASKTTGNKSIDSINTNALCLDVVEFSISILSKNGTLVSKLFAGIDFDKINNLAKQKFCNVSFYKPHSSKNYSRETYLHCKKLKSL